MKNDDPQIVIIGAAILDVLVRPADADVFRTGSSPAEEILLSPGGDALNEAAVLSKLGKRVRLETIIGNDRAGRFVISYCEECGIELPGDCIRDGIDTGVNVVLVSEDGERHFLTAPKSTLRRLTTGDIGNRYLFQTLSRNGFDEVMYDMHNHTGLPGYGYQIKAGVTTLAEQWNPELGLSWNHFMMGQIEEWFYRALGGINPDPDNPGFAHFFIRPSAPGDLQWVRCSYESVKGLIESDWKKEDGKFILSVTVPENTEATVILPYSKRKMTARPGKHVFEEPLTF